MYRRSQNIHVQILNKCKCTRINVADVYADGFIRISQGECLNMKLFFEKKKKIKCFIFKLQNEKILLCGKHLQTVD